MREGLTEEIRRADAIAEAKDHAYETKYAIRRMFARQNQLLLAELSACTDILEVGAGIGNFLVEAVRNIRHVHAVEVSSKIAQIAQCRAPTIASMSLAPAENLPFRADCFDAVIAKGVLHHLESPLLGVREMYRVLRSGGRLVILEGNPASGYRRLVLGLADCFGVEHEVSQHRHLWPEEISNLLSMFRQVRQTTVNGILAPLAYIGLGRQRVWDVLSLGQEVVNRLLPDTFAWWLLWVAHK